MKPKPRENYPPGVTCFVDTERADVDAAIAFYGGLFGWTFEDRLPPDARARFVMAQFDGLTVAGIASAPSESASPAWNTYISVESADAIVPRVKDAGGSVLVEPFDVGPAGRTAVFADPEGAAFRVWQAGRTHGAQLVNAPGSWNWSDLETRDLEAAKAFYTAVFGWEYGTVDFGQGPAAMIRVPGYGEHLEALNPGTLARHKEHGAPEGFSDAIGWMQAPGNPDGPARWAVTFTVADVDDTAGRTADLGGTVLVAPFDVPYVRLAVVRDPDGATIAIGTFKPPE
jgi:predicted enzyme related to lactoylglutathione lyase